MNTNPTDVTGTIKQFYQVSEAYANAAKALETIATLVENIATLPVVLSNALTPVKPKYVVPAASFSAANKSSKPKMLSAKKNRRSTARKTAKTKLTPIDVYVTSILADGEDWNAGELVDEIARRGRIVQKETVVTTLSRLTADEKIERASVGRYRQKQMDLSAAQV